MATSRRSIGLLLTICVVYMYLIIVIKADSPHQQDNYIASASKLHRDLLVNYSSHVRPGETESDSVLVIVKPEIVRVEDIDEGIGVFTLTIIMSQTWKDPRLVWKVSEYGGVSEIRLPLAKIWKPDIVLYNGPPDMASGFYDQLGIIYANGTVNYSPFMTVSSYCAMDMTDFPYDTQTCTKVFGSWSYPKKKLDIQFGEGVNQTTMKVTIRADETLEGQARSHPAWDVVGQSAAGVIFPMAFDYSPDFVIMSLALKLQRKSDFFIYIVVKPAVALAILVPVQFLLPALGYQRTSFGLLIILCLLTLLITLCQYIPFEHAPTPNIGKFYVISIVFSALAVFLSAVVASIASRDKKTVPDWLKTLFLGRCGLRRLLCIEPTFPVDDNGPKGNRGLLVDAEDTSIESFPVSEPEPRELDNYSNPSEKYLRIVARSSGVVAGNVMATATRARRNGEWRDVARVLDRSFFLLFSLMFVISLFSYVI